MDGQYMDHYVSPNGHVSVRRLIDGQNWRQAVAPNDTVTLDAIAPDMPLVERQKIVQLWAALPPSE